MEIKGARALWGPNIWSVDDYNVIVMQVAMEGLEEALTSEIPGFHQALQDLLPGVFHHRYDSRTAIYFPDIEKEGTRLEVVVEHVATELQRLAGMNCRAGYLKKIAQHATGYVVFSYEIKEVGMYAGRAAVKLVETLVKGGQYNPEEDIREMKAMARQNKSGPIPASIITQAKIRGIPVILSDDNVYIQLGYGAKQQTVETSVASLETVETIGRLFPASDNGRIPIIAVTGTNGKTTTTRLIAQMVQQAGYSTGYTTTEGIYLNKELVHKGDCSGPASARIVLKNPLVEFAVLESARGGIIRSGLGFDRCDCAVVTNIAEDHLGIDGIDTIEGIAAVKSVVPQTVKPAGFSVLNADDDFAYAMREIISCQAALFSLHPDNIRIHEHCKAGGLAAVWESGSLAIRKGGHVTVIDEVDNIPITYNGKAKFNVANALAAILAAYVTGISLPAIRSSLRNFHNSTDLTPGRMNTFDFGDFTIMIDYAHNPHGLRALGEYIKSVTASTKTGVITGVGDRRAEDIITLGEEAAKIFDDIIIRMDGNLRGRTESEISELLKKGVKKIKPDKEVVCFSNELDAVEHSINTARAGSFTVILVENIQSVSDFLQQRLSQGSKMQQANQATQFAR